MPLSHRAVNDLTADDVRSLIANAVPEGRRLEYKRDLPGNSDSDKKEFLADVSSFANAAGGDLIFGVDEVAGAASGLPGVELADPDAETLRLDSIIRTGVDPRIPGPRLRAIPLGEDLYVLVIRIPRSWTLPHVVTFKNYSRFYSRTSAGKYQLDVGELRTLFSRAGEAGDRIRQFRDERLARILAGEGAFELSSSQLLILHMVPFRLFDASARIDLAVIGSRPKEMRPLRSQSFSWRYNLDGFATYFHGNGAPVHSYTQLFGNGAIEAVESRSLRPRGEEPRISAPGLVQTIVAGVIDYVQVMRSLGVDPPVVILLTLTGLDGAHLLTTRHGIGLGDDHRIDRDLVQLPEIILEDWDASIAGALRPAFDALWNAAGRPMCDYYDSAGELSIPG